MKRSDLVKILELVQPALSNTNLVQVYTCFMFKDKSVTAYNDELGIIAKGAFNIGSFATGGMTLLGLLQNSRADEVDFQLTDESVVVKTGKSTFKLPYFKEDEFLFDEPKEKWAAKISINEALLKGIETCLITASTDLSKPAWVGVCFNFDLDPMALFSTDGDALTRYTAKAKYEGNGAYTVPNYFCAALLKICDETETTQGTLEVNQNWAKATLNNGFTLYGRMILIPKEKQIDHQMELDHALKDKQPFVDLPLGLHDALARARVLADPESARTTLIVEGTKLKLFTSTHMGNIRDELRIKELDDVEANVHASLIHRSLVMCDKISIREDCTAYKLGNIVLQVVANIGD